MSTLTPATSFFLLGLAWSSTSLAAPPQPAIDACSGKATAASCSFTAPTGTISGTCQTADSQFACIPESAGSTGSTGSTATPDVAQGILIGDSGGLLPDTGQTVCYDTDGAAMSCPAADQTAYGQDAQYSGNAPSFTDNGDGTITDQVTGLMWQQDPDRNDDGKIDAQDMMSFAEAVAGASSFQLAGHGDWRLPTIKELYSLIDFSGTTGTAQPSSTSVPDDAVPYIDTRYFSFAYGDTASGLRYIDAQYWSSTQYVGKTMAGVTSASGDATAFGVNFADGRIKGYGTDYRIINDKRFVRYVRGDSGYGANQFVANGDDTVTDNASRLMWLQNDSGHFKPGSRGDGSLDWAGALAWCEGLSHAGHGDWRLPNAKELQSLVDYTRSPSTSASAAIDPLFGVTGITDEGGKSNYPSYWTSTTHRDGPDFAVYIAFGEALGCMNGVVTDVHGAGAQRSDPKTASGTALGCGTGPQGDVIRVYNHARCVRTASGSTTTAAAPTYDAATQTLSLPALDAGSLGKYQARLVRVVGEAWLFDATELTPLASSAATSASYDPASLLLSVPALAVGSDNYRVQLRWRQDLSGLRFELIEAASAE